MKTSATPSPMSAARLLLAACLVASCSHASHAEVEEPEPVTDQSVNAGDVAATPIEDLNLKKDEIPPLLLEAQAAPYSTRDLNRCSQYIAAIEALNQVLGPDYDLVEANDRKMSVGSVAKSVVGAFIPFRGVIREVSGANKHEQEFQDAVLAGMMRRSFLKGMGLKLGCSYPARPADAAVKARYAAQIEAESAKEGGDKED